MERLFIIREIIFLSVTTVMKRLTTSMCVLSWIGGGLCPGFVAGLWFAELKFQCLDFHSVLGQVM